MMILNLKQIERADGNGRMEELYQISCDDQEKKKQCRLRQEWHIAIEEARKQRWCEHFEEVLNRPLLVTDEVLEMM